MFLLTYISYLFFRNTISTKTQERFDQYEDVVILVSVTISAWSLSLLTSNNGDIGVLDQPVWF